MMQLLNRHGIPQIRLSYVIISTIGFPTIAYVFIVKCFSENVRIIFHYDLMAMVMVSSSDSIIIEGA